MTTITSANIPSPALREREGPIAKRWEGEGRCAQTLTRLRALPGATLSRGAGEGLWGAVP